MRNRLVGVVLFWLAAVIVPFTCLFIVAKVYGAGSFSIGLLIYLFVYRPILVMFRLLSLKAIDKNDAWRVFLPFWADKHFKTLWFG